jgi:membrane fusion protein, multidrug efflux system
MTRHLSAIAWAVAAGLLLAACSDDAVGKARVQLPPVPVTVGEVLEKTIPVQLTAVGNAQPYTSVGIKSQINGQLVEVRFKEGQDVQKGDLLFVIDPRPFEAALRQTEAALNQRQAEVRQAQATVERDTAQLANARVQERRYRELVAKELIAREQYDQIKATYDSLNATLSADEADVVGAEETVRVDDAAIKSAEQVVRADEAAVDNARLQLGYTLIRSPVDGRTGSLMLHEGNLVRAGGTNDSTLLVINQVQPIYASFTVPQQQLPAIKRYMAQGALSVEAVPTGETRPVTGTVTFIDNAVDPTTGTIRLKAQFANEERRLWPGQFVNVAMTLAIEPDVIVAPAAAVQTGQQGAYVFVVKPDSTVETRPVVVARNQGNDAIITKGLKAGEKVVTDGQPRLVQGSAVEVRQPPARGR